MLTPCVTQYSLAYETSPNAAQFRSSFLPSVIFFKVGHQNMCAHDTLNLIARRAYMKAMGHQVFTPVMHCLWQTTAHPEVHAAEVLAPFTSTSAAP